MHIPLLNELLIIFALSIVIVFVCQKIRLPAILGFLITGVVAGPYGLGLVHGVHEVEIMAEIGIILLLFEIGIEFSLSQLYKIRRVLLIAGPTQVVLTILAAAGIARLFGLAWEIALFAGFLVSLSSTAVILKMLQERAEMETEYGQVTVGILIFQDLVIVPMILFLPLLAGTSQLPSGLEAIVPVGKTLLILALIFFGSRTLIPKLLHQLARLRNREVFLLGIVTICFSVAWLTSSVGLSLSLGAFLAGLIVSESEYSHHVLGFIVPFKDLFTSIFFVSMGMLMDISFAVSNLPILTLLVVCVIGFKGITAAFSALLLRARFGVLLLVAAALSQIGEFSFVLAKEGAKLGLIGTRGYQYFLATAVLTIGLTPFLLKFAGWAKSRSEGSQLVQRFDQKIASGAPSIAEPPVSLQAHLVIVGFGVHGRQIARAAGEAGIPYLVIELNPETVYLEKARGEHIMYGDATYDSVLEHARIAHARSVAITIPFPAAAERIAKKVKQLNPALYLIVRTRFVGEVEALYEAGADEVIPEEFETSLEILRRVLLFYKLPAGRIAALAERARADGYQMLRKAQVTGELQEPGRRT